MNMDVVSPTTHPNLQPDNRQSSSANCQVNPPREPFSWSRPADCLAASLLTPSPERSSRRDSPGVHYEFESSRTLKWQGITEFSLSGRKTKMVSEIDSTHKTTIAGSSRSSIGSAILGVKSYAQLSFGSPQTPPSEQHHIPPTKERHSARSHTNVGCSPTGNEGMTILHHKPSNSNSSLSSQASTSSAITASTSYTSVSDLQSVIALSTAKPREPMSQPPPDPEDLFFGQAPSASQDASERPHLTVEVLPAQASRASDPLWSPSDGPLKLPSISMLASQSTERDSTTAISRARQPNFLPSHKRTLSAPVFHHYEARPDPQQRIQAYAMVPPDSSRSRPSRDESSTLTPKATSSTTDPTETTPQGRTLRHFKARSSSTLPTTAVEEEQPPSPRAASASISAADFVPTNLISSEAAEQSLLEGQERCLFVDNCNTGSTLRKAISHFFGRNKSCTKRIPSHVWVYYCRKHYQRIRYRNADTYAHNQMDLIVLQMRRLQTWDTERRQNNSTEYIEHWTLSLRKREKTRLTTDHDVGEADSLTTAAEVTAPPDWLKERVDGQYSTIEIIDIALRMSGEVKDGTLSGIPEVEFLPEIPLQRADPGLKTIRKPRKQVVLTEPASLSKRKALSPLRIPESSHISIEAEAQRTKEGDSLPPPLKRARLSQTPTISQPRQHPISYGYNTAQGGQYEIAQPYAPQNSRATGLGIQEVHEASQASGVVPRIRPIRSSRPPSRQFPGHGKSSSTHVFPTIREESSQYQPNHPQADSASRDRSYSNPRGSLGGSPSRVVLPSISSQLLKHSDPARTSWNTQQRFPGSHSTSSRAGHQRSTSEMTTMNRPPWGSLPPIPSNTMMPSAAYSLQEPAGHGPYQRIPDSMNRPQPPLDYGVSQRSIYPLPPLQSRPTEHVAGAPLQSLHREQPPPNFRFPPFMPEPRTSAYERPRSEAESGDPAIEGSSPAKR